MKKFVTTILLLCMILSLAACSKVEITMQEIYDASLTDAILKNHESVYIRTEMDDKIWGEMYLTKDYAYDYILDEEFSFVQFMTDDACYYDNAGDRLLYLFITPDGVGDFARLRAERYASVILGEETLDNIIESVSKKDGRITVKTFLNPDGLAAEKEEFGATSATFEYVLDAKTREMISLTSAYTYDDGSADNVITKMTYDAEVPEMVKTFLGYVNQTENLRNITVVSNPGTEKEESKSIQAPKGLIIGLYYEDEEYEFEVYTDAACTEAYDPYADTDSDLTIYIKWTE